ncbi:hypothetical protein T492DRAFT_1110866 [Pavlovales sp. CCMP2436]|nr:hypothetical protein T492DRAFT_1110866 [Pavlovales sp. CCMP2436]
MAPSVFRGRGEIRGNAGGEGEGDSCCGGGGGGSGGGSGGSGSGGGGSGDQVLSFPAADLKSGGVWSGLQLRTTFPNRAYGPERDNESITLLGFAPSATLHLRRVRGSEQGGGSSDAGGEGGGRGGLGGGEGGGGGGGLGGAGGLGSTGGTGGGLGCASCALGSGLWCPADAQPQHGGSAPPVSHCSQFQCSSTRSLSVRSVSVRAPTAPGVCSSPRLVKPPSHPAIGALAAARLRQPSTESRITGSQVPVGRAAAAARCGHAEEEQQQPHQRHCEPGGSVSALADTEAAQRSAMRASRFALLRDPNVMGRML